MGKICADTENEPNEIYSIHMAPLIITEGHFSNGGNGTLNMV